MTVGGRRGLGVVGSGTPGRGGVCWPGRGQVSRSRADEVGTGTDSRVRRRAGFAWFGLGSRCRGGEVGSGSGMARRVVKVVGWAVRGSSDWTEMARAGLSERSRHGSGLARRGGERRGSARIVQWGGLVRTGRGSGSRRAGGWVGRGRASRRWRGRARRGEEPDWQVGEMWACDERGLACRTARGGCGT